MRPDPRQLISDPDARAMFGGISAMTAVRWGRDPKVGWLKVAAVVRGRKFYYLRDAEALVDRLIELTEKGEATTAQPALPRHRQAKAGGRS
jgi:hypothetical protein